MAPAAGAAVLCAWALQSASLGPVWPAAAGAFALGAALAARWVRVDAGALAWDGAEWTFCDHPGDVQVMLDFDRWMLLRFDAHGVRRRAWLALGAAGAGSSWHALRAALYSRRPSTKPE